MLRIAMANLGSARGTVFTSGTVHVPLVNAVLRGSRQSPGDQDY